ncbi:hypothetical protein BCR44DRAFT_41527 [Catenaria anguillulae PL171]|uniref:Uncharacterized protein n=1 Tax=Catenaria anguillulae PL171 TaxID=765915 RepID=A0A1Y2GXZ9_9FUNG|nr:hypothetical protein BCR44DRAFT_41527 [Catenaria anguillulae PL171]
MHTSLQVWPTLPPVLIRYTIVLSLGFLAYMAYYPAETLHHPLLDTVRAWLTQDTAHLILMGLLTLHALEAAVAMYVVYSIGIRSPVHILGWVFATMIWGMWILTQLFEFGPKAGGDEKAKEKSVAQQFEESKSAKKSKTSKKRD